MAESGGTERSGGADRADHKGSAAEARGSVSAERAGEIAEKIASGKGAAERASVETAAQDAAPGPSPEQAAAEAEKQRQEAEAARASYGEPVASSAPAPSGPAAGPTASATAAAAAPRSWGQTLAEQAAVTLGGAIGAASAVTGWAADMIGGVAAAAKTGWQAGTVGLEAATGLVPDSYAARQRADLEARVDAFKAAAQEILRDPAAVAAAVAENYAARFEAADALEAAYRSGRADLSVLTEAASMRAEARTELGILGVETAATAVAGVGALAKGLRAAHIADHLTDAAPLAMAMAGTERARVAAEVARALPDAVPGRPPASAAEVTARISTELLRRTPGVATGRGVPVEGDWLRAAVREGVGAPVPDRIAAKLAGREFRDFRAFREAFWKEVAQDEALAKEFNAASRRDLQRGLAPQAPETASVGRREKFELDHIVPLKRGGSVYDLDNIQIMSPKNHVEKSRNE